MKKNDKAVDDLTAAIALGSGNPAYYYERGAILFYPVDDDEGAVRDFERAIQLDPGHTEARRQCCLALLKLAIPERALEHAVAALQLEPENAETHYCLGEAYFSLGRSEEAVASFKKAVELDPATDYYNNALNRANSVVSRKGQI